MAEKTYENEEVRSPGSEGGSVENGEDLSPVTVNPLKRDADAAELPTLSKSQLKKLKKKQQWEDGREARKAKRKDKMQQKRARRRADYEEKHAHGDEDKTAISDSVKEAQEKKPHVKATQLPITFVFDCQFDDLMNDNERISLGSQLTRCYSDNRKSRFRAHLALSSFGGKLKERFEGILDSHHLNWHGVRFLNENIVETAELAKAWMKEERGGRIAGAMVKADENGGEVEQTGESQEGDVIYLSSDSPDTLTELKPYHTYIIGALVDKNRHKGICYKRAVEAGMKTAKLPIGDYLQMNSRKVLTTNHVNEIMLKWLELGDWGEAFIQVIPKRKGGALKEQGEKEAESGEVVKQSEPAQNGDDGEEST